MGQVINGYEITTEFTSKNAGTSQWAFCRKNGSEFFIKKLNDPTFPLDPSAISKKAFEARRKECLEFFKDRNSYYSELREHCRTGNNVVPIEFFRCESKYYVITEKLDFEPRNLKEVAETNEKAKMALCCSVLNSIASLHSIGVVHGDLKQDNIMLKSTQKGFFTGKVIDFDSGFSEKKQNYPLGKIVGDEVYFAPETFIKTEYEAEDIILTCKADIFSLGIILHEYWTGQAPRFDRSKYKYCWQVRLDGGNLEPDCSLPAKVKSLISDMLSFVPDDRPTAAQALAVLKGIDAPTPRPDEGLLKRPDDLD